jgi:PAS domain S-box-containing protein
MRIGILPSWNPEGGGVYQYSQNIVHGLNTWLENGCNDKFVLLLNNTTGDTSLISLTRDRWEVVPIITGPPPPLSQRVADGIRRLIGEGLHREALRWLRRQLVNSRNGPKPEPRTLPDPEVIKYRGDLRDCFLRAKLDLLLYTYPTPICFETGMPYVIAIHDLQHRLQPQFPEVSANGEWEYREYMFRNACRCATLIIAESEVGKEDILNFYGPYGVTEDKIKILPYLSATYLATGISEPERQRVRTAYHLPERYLFYPAQFWPHKNHARIVQALSLLKREQHTNVPIVFCGSHSGDIRENTYNAVMSLRSNLGMENQIHDLGYVPEQDMSPLYSEAIALVMPTFFGPTNIPVLEAWAFRCPVLTSDIHGVREQVGDAAVLVNPRSVESIAEGIYRIWTDPNLRRALMDAGCRRLSSYTPDDFRNRLIEILEEAKDRVRSRGMAVGGRNINLHDIEKLVCDHPAVSAGRAVAFGLHNAELATEDVIVVAEAETDEGLKTALEIERAVRNTIVAKLGLTPRAVYLKPRHWIVNRTTGKPARSTIREKLLVEQPEVIGKEHEDLFEPLNESIMVRSMEGTINSWNRRAEELYGWRKEEALGKVSHDLLQTQFPKPLQEIESDLVQSGRWEGKLLHASRDGGRVVVASRWVLNLQGQNGPVVEINTPTD